MDRQTCIDTQTDRQTDRNTPLPYRGGVITAVATTTITAIWLEINNFKFIFNSVSNENLCECCEFL